MSGTKELHEFQKIQENDAPLLIVFGQSNAHGHGTKLPPEERILSPFPMSSAWSADTIRPMI